ncbi:MAG: glycosyl transferase family 28, partial [Phaeodactylibacter sp.]|nr:glycosyl transferase family 28 [Phaeodactylibacter sp.]
MPQPTRILIAPLNWGLGHATRCIPIIQAFLDAGVAVTLASDGAALALLRREFPQLPAIELPGYEIHYKSSNMVRNLTGQLPKVSRAIYREHRIIRQLCRNKQFEAIITDNRFGCFSRQIPSVFITHQLRIRTPYPLLDRLVRYFNRLFIRQFRECWVPDRSTPPRLAGDLSEALPGLRVRYIGNLSRMQPLHIPAERNGLVVLSVPEPKRSL